MNKDLYLTDLIDPQMLQDLQNIFSELTGMAALTTDVSGTPVTQGSNFTDFCMKYTRQSELGKKRCETCDKMGAEITHASGKPCTYFCHAGLIDYAAPIMAGGKIIGSFIGGQVLTAPPDLEKARQIAVELGIDPDEYVEAIKKVKIVDKKEVERASKCLCMLANNLSNLAYQGYCLLKNNEAIEKAARMKSDFLANMSHEIRTPMNAVLGMADLALREKMSEAAREYIHQIKTSGKNLLVIINDILDFSKIESGKMDIIEVEYEPLSVVNDVSSIVNNRIGNKNVEFTMDIAPDLPKKIWGDNVRIHQIILNLLTNAVKFTKEGQVNLSIKSRKLNSKLISLMVSISDTGQGIKKEDQNKIFHSFQQVDSKRNRNIEGTGLGLAITQRLLGLMHGTITVDSEYGKGSTFFFELPQKIIDDDPTAVKIEEDITAAVLISNMYVRRQIFKDLQWLCKECIDLSSTSKSIEEIDVNYFIIEKKLFTGTIEKFFTDNPQKQCLVIDKFNGINDSNLPNVRVLRKPVYSISLYNAMGMKSTASSHQENKEDDYFTFTAPEASILIVDDNHVNLVVASGLLEPLQMHINTAMSAEEAIDMIDTNMYDLIFMDHMMPEVDGVEATHIIRRLIPGYESIPIIALSANAVGDAKEMFIKEGMNDFVAKPIEVKDIVSKLRKWLPQEKIVHVDKVYSDDKPEPKNNIQIEGIDAESAISLIGSERLFMTVLKEYYVSIDKKTQTIMAHKNAQEWREYTIEVHALKSISKQVGANHVSELAAKLEQAGNKNDIDYINKNTDEMIEEYQKYKVILKDVFPEIVLESNKNDDLEADPELVLGMLDEMQDALDAFDTLLIDDVVEKMMHYNYSEEYEQYLEELKEAAENSDIDECGRIVSEWRDAVS